MIVTNVDKVVFTGNKWQQKFYQRYSGHPGGQKDEQAWKLFQRHPDRILKLAIQRMMPKNKIGRHMMGKLKLYSGPVHEHQAQAPIPLEAIDGRPSASGAIYAPKPIPPARKSRRKPEAAAPRPTRPPSPSPSCRPRPRPTRPSCPRPPRRPRPTPRPPRPDRAGRRVTPADRESDRPTARAASGRAGIEPATDPIGLRIEPTMAGRHQSATSGAPAGARPPSPASASAKAPASS